jgi:outer membrane protein OmpA-like peptidoglycan-associated protein
MLLKNPKWTVELVGHNDVEEERAAAEIEDLTEELSDMDQKRVDKLKYDLIQKGIDETRIRVTVKDAKEVNQDEFDESDDTELQWAKNRRVEFILRRN